MENPPTSDDSLRRKIRDDSGPPGSPTPPDDRPRTDVPGREDVLGTVEPRGPLETAPSTPEAKAALRARIRLARRRRSDSDRNEAAQHLARTVMGIPQVRRAETVTCYVSFPTEPGTGPLRRALRQAGIRILLPVTVPPGDLDWVMDPGPSSKGQDRGGKPPEGAGELLGRTAIARAHVLIVPALAVDVLGHRLGQGGGYYDRALPLADPDAPVVALLHADEFLRPAQGHGHAQEHGPGQGLVPTLPHDRTVDLVAVPDGVIRIERDR